LFIFKQNIYVFINTFQQNFIKKFRDSNKKKYFLNFDFQIFIANIFLALP